MDTSLNEKAAMQQYSPNVCSCACPQYTDGHPPVHLCTHDHTVHNPRPRSRKRRIIRVICTAFTFWVVYIMFFGLQHRNTGPSSSFGTGCGRSRWFGNNSGASFVDSPFPSDTAIVGCADLTNDDASPNFPYDHSSSTSFSLPLSAQTLFLLARGGAVGRVDVLPGHESGKDAQVEVVVKYNQRYGHEHDGHALHHVRVCELNRGQDGKEKGIGVFAPQWSGRRPRGGYNIYFDITVRLPVGTGDKDSYAHAKGPLRVNGFETNLPIFAHHLGDLAGSVHFDVLSLNGALSPVEVESVSVTDGQVTNSNSKISGMFNASTTLRLTTSNAPIEATIGLSNDDKNTPSKLTMRTSNAPLTAQVSLISTSHDHTGGDFILSGKTSLSPLSLTLSEAPLGSRLHLDAETAISRAAVSLPNTYEGTFRLETSMGKVGVRVDEHVEDPAGKGRKRDVEVRQNGSEKVQGSVKWGEKEGKGEVQVKTSLGAVELNI